MSEQEIKEKIRYLKEHIPKIRNKQTRLQQQKYMHRLIKEIKVYRGYINA